MVKKRSKRESKCNKWYDRRQMGNKIELGIAMLPDPLERTE